MVVNGWDSSMSVKHIYKFSVKSTVVSHLPPSKFCSSICFMSEILDEYILLYFTWPYEEFMFGN